MKESNCDTCRFRQRNLDPEGCFKQVGSTDIVGRALVRWLGCHKWMSDADIHDKMIEFDQRMGKT